MAVGKNKRISKGKKGGKKKVTDPFIRKEWYDVKAPAVFQNRQVGKMPVNRTQGQKIASDSLRGRVVEVSLADLQKDEELAFRKVQLRVEDVQGRSVLTNFHGMDFTTDKLRSLVRKWQTLIEANVDVTTSDGYKLRIFAIGFTRKRQNTLRKTAYAQHSQIKAIRKKMFDIITREASSSDLKDLVQKFIPEVIGKQIERETQGIYPMQNVFIRKVKVVKAPKFDAGKLMELHGEASAAPAATPVASAPAAKKPAPPKKAPSKKVTGKKTGKKTPKKQMVKFVIDCSAPINDGIMDAIAFETFLKQKIKVNGKAGNIAGKVNIDQVQGKLINISAEPPFSKRYLKYLTKKFLKKQNLRDWIHVVATAKNTYVLKYFAIQDDEETQ